MITEKGKRSPGTERVSAWPDRTLLFLVGTAFAISLAALWVFQCPLAKTSPFDLPFLVGPTARSLLDGKGMLVCTEAMGTPGNPICFHGARMPIPSATIALGSVLFGPRYMDIALFKGCVFIIPLLIAIWRVCVSRPISQARRLLIAILLILPFGTTSFLADVVNLQVEEGYSYSFIALAVALLFFRTDRIESNRRWGLINALVFGVSIAFIYLAKSSMALVALAFTVAFLLQEDRPALRILVLLMAMSAPAGWAIHQYHATHRYSFGTSLDGINFHKGNNEYFLATYPPMLGVNLDRFDGQLNAGHFFLNEWQFSDFHKNAAVQYIETHPGETLRADLRKVNVLLFTLRKEGGGTVPKRHIAIVEVFGMLILRGLLWASLGGAAYQCFWSARQNAMTRLSRLSVLYLGFVLTAVLPYVIGFGYTRHASILIYPAALFCCALLCTKAVVSSV